MSPSWVTVRLLPVGSVIFCSPPVRSMRYCTPLRSVSLNVVGSKMPSLPKAPPLALPSLLKNSELSPATSRVEVVAVPGCGTNTALERPGKKVLPSVGLRSNISWCPSGQTTVT